MALSRETEEVGRSPASQGRAAAAGAVEPVPVSSTASIPNADCAGCGVPMRVSAEHLADPDNRFHCFSCCFGG
jgi:hypothetical protein